MVRGANLIDFEIRLLDRTHSPVFETSTVQRLEKRAKIRVDLKKMSKETVRASILKNKFVKSLTKLVL